MKKPKPGTKIVQKSSGYHEYEVVPDDETDQRVGGDRFAVRPIDPGPRDEIGTFPLEVLKQDNFFVSDE